MYTISDRMQTAIWRSTEEVLDTIWAAADCRIDPTEISKDRLSAFESGFKLGKDLVSRNVDVDSKLSIWAVDTGAEYLALFIGTEESVIHLFKELGVKFLE